MERPYRSQHEEGYRAEQHGKQTGHNGQPAAKSTHLANQHGPTRAGSPYKGRPAQQGNRSTRPKREWRDML